MPMRVDANGNVVQVLNSGVVVPYPYEIWADGVYAATGKAPPAQPDEQQALPTSLSLGRKRLMFRPLWVSGLGLAVDTEEPLIQLTYANVTGQLQQVWLGRGQITDHRLLTQMGASGLPIDSVNAEAALMFLRAMEAENGMLLPVLKVGHRSGPYLVDGKMGWLVGKQWIGNDEGCALEADPRSNAKYTMAFQPHGDEQLWLAKWRELRDAGWVTRFLMGATFAAPMLRILKCRTFILHHWGDSSHGKTATAVMALSAWGNPELLYSSLNRTAISITEIFKHVTDLPVLFDEKQVSTVTSEELIYSVCTGSGRERGDKNGGLRQDRQQWLTIARTTGEVPLISDSDLGGQYNRLIQIHSVAFKERREAESIYPFTNENYGFAGPAFLRHLADALSNGGLPIITQLYKEMREALINRIGIDSNHAQYCAVIATAQTLSESWLLGIPVVEARERALDDATLALKETAPKKQLSYSERALSKLRDHWISNAGFYVDDTSDEGRENAHRVFKMIGVETAYGMAYVPHEANELLIKAGYGPERVWRDFQNNGWLMLDGDSPLNRMTLRNGKSPDHPVYLIRAEIFFTDSVRQTKLQLINGGLNKVVGLEES